MQHREVRFSPNSHRPVPVAVAEKEGVIEDIGGYSQSQGGGGRGKKRGVMHALLTQPPPASSGRGKRERREEEQQLAAAALPPQPSPLPPVGPPPPLPIVLTAQDAVRRQDEVGSGVVVEELELELEKGGEGPLGPSLAVAAEGGVCGPSGAAPPSLPLVRFAFRRGGGEGRRVLECVGASAGETGEDADARLRRLLSERRRRLGPACADPQGAVARARVAVAMAAARAAGTEQEVRGGFDFDLARMGKGMHHVRL